MAYVLCSRRLSSKLATKFSLYSSSSSPLSYLIPHYELLNPRISSSVFSIFYNSYNSTSSTPYYSCIKHPSKSYPDYYSNIISRSFVKSSHISLDGKRHPSKLCENVRCFSSSSEDDKKIDDDELPKVDKLYYFLSEEDQKFIYEVSKGKYFSSTRGDFLKVLPKDALNNITREDFNKGAEILLKNMDSQKYIFTKCGYFPFILTLVAYKYPIAPFYFLCGCMLQRLAACERRSMKKVELLMEDHYGQIQIRFLQLLRQLKNSDDRDCKFASLLIFILVLTAYLLLFCIVDYIY